MQSSKVHLLSTDHKDSESNTWPLPFDPSLKEVTVALSGPAPNIEIRNPQGRTSARRTQANENTHTNTQALTHALAHMVTHVYFQNIMHLTTLPTLVVTDVYVCTPPGTDAMFNAKTTYTLTAIKVV